MLKVIYPTDKIVYVNQIYDLLAKNNQQVPKLRFLHPIQEIAMMDQYYDSLEKK